MDGNPNFVVPTPPTGDSSKRAANTEFVTGITGVLVTGVSSVFARTGAVVAAAGDYDVTQIYKSQFEPGGRLTLTTATPVLTSTVSGATTVYYTPYKSQLVPIYDGTRFSCLDIGGELSQATSDSTKSPAAVAASKLYDVFVWSDSGTYRATRGPAWSSSTSRGTGAGTTELTRLNGILVNANAVTNGPGANRGTYVGTIASNGSSTIDFIFGASAAGGTAGSFNLWNCYNRTLLATLVQDSTSNYAYATASWQQADASAKMQVTYVYGLNEDVASATYTGHMQGTTGVCAVGVGIDSTTVNSGVGGTGAGGVNSNQYELISLYSGFPGIGQHVLAAIEFGAVSATFNLTTAPHNNGLIVTLML